MLTPPRQVYDKEISTVVVVFDLQHPGTAERLRRERAGWRGFADVEYLDADHTALIIRPGDAMRLAR
jgi:hypothetical protein